MRIWALRATAAEPATMASRIIRKTEISSVQAKEEEVKQRTSTLAKVIRASRAMITTVSQSSMRSERGSSGCEGVSAAPFSVGGDDMDAGSQKITHGGGDGVTELPRRRVPGGRKGGGVGKRVGL